ncbi:MAG: YbgC/FadM family acyl-CoA thioesterase [Candidatus Omnitrophica bacterium]|nr:YbgC/FadM family acyl-CoA thioesterase [Candidatus Omnitrophota bacterium]MDD5665404.1 YbgC/FadM family acyl-CoA thioesterase [Candidatus Omnitrophota bacterium]
MQVNIFYHHTDCGGVVYYANYLKFFEEARTEFFSQRGFSIKELADSGTMFVVARQEVDYKSPAVYGDTLEIITSVIEMSAVKIIFEHEVRKNGGQVTTKAKTTLVCVGKDLRPKAIPEEIRSKF